MSVVATAVERPQWIHELRATFTRIAGPDAPLDLEAFTRALGVGDAQIARRLFALVDRDGSGSISLDEYCDAAERIAGMDDDAQVEFAFALHDLDGNGTISTSELRTVLTEGVRELDVRCSEAELEHLVALMFESADTNWDGVISLDEFRASIARWPGLAAGVASSVLRRLCPRGAAPKQAPRGPTHLARARAWIATHMAQSVILGLWGSANAYLFVQAFVAYGSKGIFVQLARGAGACLNFNGALILIPMMRALLTRLRRARVGRWLPLDDAVGFHRLVGLTMFALATLHTAAHLLNYAASQRPFADQLLMTAAGLTGLVLMVVFTLMWATSLKVIRRSGRFELFWFAHLLYSVWFALLLVHGPVFWEWALVPALGFVIDRVLQSRGHAWKTTTVAATAHPSGVTHLVMARPEGFDFDAGAYVSLRIPEVAKHEWHPFTLSSAPEDPHLTVDVRRLGNWTRALHARALRGGDPLRVELAGPYGTPSVHVFEAKVAVLVGAGIGVTPFASILRSIVNRKRRAATDPDAPPLGLEKVYFYWLNRDQAQFEWFTGFLAELEAENDGLLELNILMTRLRSGGRMEGCALHMALALMHGSLRKDLITGLQTRTRGGRPDWSAELDRVRAAHPEDRVDVFLCGPDALARALKKAALERGFTFRKEHF